MIGYSIGFACVPFLLLGEMLPGRMRNLLSAFVSSFNLVMTFLVLKFFPTIYMRIGFHGLFWLYGGISLAGGIMGFLLIPETKGKTLEEIELYFSGLNLLANLEDT
jgi:facilitated trehalose transporter